MSIREDQFNGRIATIIRECIAGLQWKVQEETDGTLASSQKRPDILITRQMPEPPIVIENEYNVAQVEVDCKNKLGQKLRPEYGGQTIHTVIGVYTPTVLQDVDNGDVAEDMLRQGAILEYAVYTGLPDDYDRFPESGFIKGNVRNLVEFIRPAAEPTEVIMKAADTLSNGSAIAAKFIMDAAKSSPSLGVNISEILRQPWPYLDGGNTRQQEANRQARQQTAVMAATIIINALAYQQNLDGHEGIRGLAKVRDQSASDRLTKDSVIDEFNNILRINFWPIFYVARSILLEIPASIASEMLEEMAATSDGIIDAIRHNDIAGTLFQRLIADRQTLKTYYTSPASTTLMAHLAISEEADWKDPETLKNYNVADYSCGSGGIMLAAYQRIRELYRVNGGNPDDYHDHLMSEALTACDIVPAAAHLTASLLSSVAPTTPYRRTRCVLFPFGGQRKRDEKGNIVKDSEGNPVKETDNKGRPIVHIGSLDLLDLNITRFQSVFPPDEQTALGATGIQQVIEVSFAPLSQDLVAMNPPFTRPTKHSPRNSDNVDPKNPAFAAFGTTDAEQKEMKRLIERLGKNTISDGNAGLATHFSAIAHNMVKAGGHIALILPTASILAGSYDPNYGKNGRTYSWQKFRNLLYGNYNDIIVVSIAQPNDKDSAFSADSDYADCMVIARRLRHGERPEHRIHFVNIRSVPASKLEAQETARSIKTAIGATSKPGEHCEIRIGDEDIGFVRSESVRPNERWHTVRIINADLVDRLEGLMEGKLKLPQGNDEIALPMTALRNLGGRGAISRDINEDNRGPFQKRDGYTMDREYPMLWNHYPLRKALRKGKDPQKAMLTRPDSHGVVKKNREEAAARLWRGATHLHINAIFRFNANSTSAAYTDQLSLGGRAWPTFKLKNSEWEKFLCLWLNSTLGIAIYWLLSDRGQDGRGAMSVTAIPDMPALDAASMTDEQIAAAARIFEDLKLKNMLPANEAWHDPVRKTIDHRLFTEVLGLEEGHVNRLTILRQQWCREPTVTGGKSTGPTG